MRRLIPAAVVLGGALLLTACAPAAPLGAEQPDPVGTWTADPPKAGDTPMLELKADGTATGTDGCNGIGGDWTATDDGVEFDGLFGTLMFCEGVDDWLRDAATGRLSGDQLTILDEQGNELGVLHRAA